MIRSLRLLVPVLLLTLAPIQLRAQVPTGTPPFGSFGGGPDIVDLANLNVHLDIPVLNKPGRGTDFTYDLSYDSSVWYPVVSGSTTTWQPVLNWGWRGVTEISTGYVSVSETSTNCYSYPRIPTGFKEVFSNRTYHDPWGIPHVFPGISEFEGGTCGSTVINMNAIATDDSGYTLKSTNGAGTVTIISAAGKFITPPYAVTSGAATSTDRNGNEITVNGSGVFTDTLGTTALTVAGVAPTSTTFSYTPPSGTPPAMYTMKYTTYSIQTNFGCSGVGDYGTTGNVTASLVSEIDLPDGVSKYTFTYEPTYGHSGFYTGRLASVILPTGGTISYLYSTGGTGVNGITCADGSASVLLRTTPDTTPNYWTYARTMGTGSASATLITAPQPSYDSASNQTIAQFQGIYPTQTDTYQGSAPGFSLPITESVLQTTNLKQETQICYNGSATPCPTLAVTLPILQRTVTASVSGGGNLWSAHTDKYNAYGYQTESDDYDFSSSPPGTRLQQSLITYAALGANLNAFTQTVKVLDSGSNIQSRQDTTYDQYGSGMACVTGAAQHDDTDYGCSFTGRGNVTSVTGYTDPVTPSGGITKNFTYDSLGNLLTAQLNCCELKTYVYSAASNYAYLASVTGGSSSPQLSTITTYDLNMGLPLTSTDPNGLEATLTYDNMGRPLTAVFGSNPATTYTYTDSAPWTALICSPVQGTNTACQKTIADSQGRSYTSQLVTGTGTVISATDTNYDAVGRPYRVSNPYTSSPGYWTQTNFDAVGRAIKTTLQDNSLSLSSYTDNTVTTTDPAGNVRKGVSDGLGRLTSVYEPDPTNGNSLTLQTSYTYNIFNQLTQVAQGSLQTRTYVYDAMGRLSSATTPEAGTVCYGTVSGATCQANGYDSWNNLLYRTDARGVVTSYLYDNLNRLVGIAYPTVPSGSAMPNVCKANGSPSNNANVCYAYGTTAGSFNNGLPISMTDASGSEAYTYNSLEQLTQLQKVIGSTTYTTSYVYNLANELSQITYPSGRVVAQSFDTVGRLCAVGASGSTCTTGTTYATGFTYNTAQLATAYTYGNSIAASFGYSSDRLQLMSLSYAKSGTALFSLNYSYGTSPSNDGLISEITDNVQGGRTVGYTYDSLYRLSTALTTGSTAYPQWGLSWKYDRYANRTAQIVTAGTSVPSNSISVSASTNQVTGSPYVYDANGNMTNDGSNTNVYDGENRATSATNSGASGTYTYDGQGLRVQKVSGSTTTVYVFSGSKVIAEYDNGAAPTLPSREYIYSGSTLLAKIDSTGTHYYHQDMLSNRLVTDSSGNVYEQLGHYPYGEKWYNSTNDKLFFTTYERDSESGNDYAMARYYVNRLGRFSSVDSQAGSTENPQSLNRYAYVADNPVNLVDPFGMDCDQSWVDDATSDPGCFLGADGSGGGGGNGGLAGGGGALCNLDGVSTPCFIINQYNSTSVLSYAADNYPPEWGLNPSGAKFEFDAGGNEEGSFGGEPFRALNSDDLGFGLDGLQNPNALGPTPGPGGGGGGGAASTANCITKALRAFLGVQFTVTSVGSEVGGHQNFNLQASGLDIQQTSFQNTLAGTQGFPPPHRFPGSPSVHLENTSAPIPSSYGFIITATAHVDLVYSNGLFGGIGHGLVDYLIGHIVQALGGNIDPKCK